MGDLTGLKRRLSVGVPEAGIYQAVHDPSGEPAGARRHEIRPCKAPLKWVDRQLLKMLSASRTISSGSIPEE